MLLQQLTALLIPCVAAFADDMLVANSLPPLKPKCVDCSHNDIIFALDGSQSILSNVGMYDKMTKLVNDILASDTPDSSVQKPVWAKYVGGRGVHVGLIKFADDIEEASLFQFLASNPDIVRRQINNWFTEHPISGGLSDICKALKAACNDFHYHGQANVPRTLVLLTDGAPNTQSGYCDINLIDHWVSRLKNDYKVEILVVAVNGINGAQAQSNYKTLSTIASTDPISGVPLLWNLTNIPLEQVRNNLTSRRCKRAGVGDISWMFELNEILYYQLQHIMSALLHFTDDVKPGLPGQHTRPLLSVTPFNTVANVSICPCGDGGCLNSASKQYITSAQIQEFFMQPNQCPAAFNSTLYGSQNSSCEIMTGHSDLYQPFNVLLNNGVYEKYTGCDRSSAPNIGIFFGRGICDGGICKRPGRLAEQLNGFKELYPLRYAIALGGKVNHGAVNQYTNYTMLSEIVGAQDVDGGYVLNCWSGNSHSDTTCNATNEAIIESIPKLAYSIKHYLVQQPGCHLNTPGSGLSFCLEIVLDESGSMNSQWKQTINDIATIVRQLQWRGSGYCPQEYGIVGFSNTAEMICSLGNCGNIVDTLLAQQQDGGATVIVAGLRMAINDLQQHCPAGRHKYILLASDGRDDEDFSDIVNTMNADGITLFAMQTSFNGRDYGYQNLCTIAGSCSNVVTFNDPNFSFEIGALFEQYARCSN